MQEIKSFYDWQLSFKKKREKEGDRDFFRLLFRFCNRKSQNKMAVLSEDDFEFEVLDMDAGILKCTIKAAPSIEIDKKALTVKHDCHEFKNVNLFKKQFCSHLVKLFLVLRSERPKEARSFLQHLIVNDYDFFPDPKRKNGIAKD